MNEPLRIETSGKYGWMEYMSWARDRAEGIQHTTPYGQVRCRPSPPSLSLEELEEIERRLK